MNNQETVNALFHSYYSGQGNPMVELVILQGVRETLCSAQYNLTFSFLLYYPPFPYYFNSYSYVVNRI